LIISPILLLARVVRAYDLGSNKSHPLPKGPHLPALLPLTSIVAITVLRSERPLLRGLLALYFSNFCLFIILDYYKIKLMAYLKNVIIAIIIKMVRILWTKVKLRTIATEVITAAIRLIITLGTVTAVIAIIVIRPTVVQGDENRQPLLVVN